MYSQLNYAHLQICTTSKDFNIIGMRSLKLCMTMQKMHVPCRMDFHTYLILGFGDLKGIDNLYSLIIFELNKIPNQIG